MTLIYAAENSEYAEKIAEILNGYLSNSYFNVEDIVYSNNPDIIPSVPYSYCVGIELTLRNLNY